MTEPLLIELSWPAKELSPNARPWAVEEIEALTIAYTSAEFGEEIGLDALAVKLGRHKTNISRKARELGLTDIARRQKRQRKDKRKYGDMAAWKAVAPEVSRRRIAVHGHNRGMLGKRHSQETKDRLAATNIAVWNNLSRAERDALTDKAVRAKLEKYGKLALATGEGSSWKAGWREIADRRIYFRSRWEANYARYLQWLKDRGEIIDWEYEPETFWFERIKRGVRSYLPDFRVHELNGAKPLHEVKGWMDARSRTTLNRMRIYHPHETIILIQKKEYQAISRFSAMIGGWE